MAKRPTRSQNPTEQAPGAPVPPRPRVVRKADPAVTNESQIFAETEAPPPPSETFGAADVAGAVADDRMASTRSISMGSEPSEEDIRLRAYHRFLERGGGDGADIEDWVEAERELRGRRG